MTTDDVEAARAEAQAKGAASFELRTRAATRDAFFDAAREGLPLDPPVLGSKSWDALADSIWAGLDGVGTRDVAIAWLGASNFKELAPAEFHIAYEILKSLTERLSSWEATDGEPKQITVLLE